MLLPDFDVDVWLGILLLSVLLVVEGAGMTEIVCCG